MLYEVITYIRMKKIAYPSLLTLLLLNIADICNLHAATFYVATNHTIASDANTGTSTEPLKTIAAGVNKLFAGDTLVVQEGIYRESITITRVITSYSIHYTKLYDSKVVVLLLPTRPNIGSR